MSDEGKQLVALSAAIGNLIQYVPCYTGEHPCDSGLGAVLRVEEELKRLRAMIGTTVDGVLIPDCETFHCPFCGEKCEKADSFYARCQSCKPGEYLFYDDCYASREAALAAINDERCES